MNGYQTVVSFTFHNWIMQTININNCFHCQDEHQPEDILGLAS